MTLPEQAPPRYAPMTWAELRAWEQRGITFRASHRDTSHPGPGGRRAESARADWIVGAAPRRGGTAGAGLLLPERAAGRLRPREISTLKELGLRGAVVGTPGYADAAELRARAEHAFTVRRFNYPDNYRLASRYVSGIERLFHGTGGAS